MKLQLKLIGLIFCFSVTTLQAEHLPIGSEVLANCHGFHAKGKVKRLHKEHYVINFPKQSRPLFCTPFAWDSMFLTPFQTVPHYTGKLQNKSGFFSVTNEVTFKAGDKLTIYFREKPRGHMFTNEYTVDVVIKEIASNGSALLQVVKDQAPTEAGRIFNRWVGGNYVILDFTDDLVAERFTITGAEKK